MKRKPWPNHVRDNPGLTPVRISDSIITKGDYITVLLWIAIMALIAGFVCRKTLMLL